MKEKNLDHDYPVDLQTNNLYSLDYLDWQKDFTTSIKALAAQETAEESK